MKRREYLNNQLAKDYITAGIRGAFDVTQYKIQGTRIEQCQISIADFYYEHNESLEELKAPGIGSQTKSLLELILKQGIKKAIILREKQRKERIENIYHTTRPHPKFHPDAGADDSSFERGIKKYES